MLQDSVCDCLADTGSKPQMLHWCALPATLQHSMPSCNNAPSVGSDLFAVMRLPGQQTEMFEGLVHTCYKVCFQYTLNDHQVSELAFSSRALTFQALASGP